MIRGIEKRIDLSDCHSLLGLSHLHNFVARAHFALLENAEVESGTAAGGQQRRHSRLVHPNANAITGNAGLRDFEECAPDPVLVADAGGIIGQALDCEILTEASAGLRIAQVGPPQLLLPITIGLDLIDKDGALFPSVARQISLAVSVKIQPANQASAIHWIFPDSGVNGAAFPLHIPWKTDVHC